VPGPAFIFKAPEHLSADPMRALAFVALALAAAIASPAAEAQRGHAGGGGRGYAGGGAQVAPGPARGGAHWAAGPYRPLYGHAGWGYGYGFGVGLGLGYGAGWALTGSPWYWGWPAAFYGAPWIYPYGVFAPGYPALALDDVTGYVQQPAAESVAPPAPRTAASHWYYCTEPAGYYPYVQQCSRPWVAVRPDAVPPAGSAPPAAPAP
jgi:hypothetical protein